MAALFEIALEDRSAVGRLMTADLFEEAGRDLEALAFRVLAQCPVLPVTCLFEVGTDCLPWRVTVEATWELYYPAWVRLQTPPIAEDQEEYVLLAGGLRPLDVWWYRCPGGSYRVERPSDPLLEAARRALARARVALLPSAAPR